MTQRTLLMIGTLLILLCASSAGTSAMTVHSSPDTTISSDTTELDQTSIEQPIRIDSDVDIKSDAVSFNYQVQNLGHDNITTFYLAFGASDKIDFITPIIPDGWTFGLLYDVPIDDRSTDLIYWTLSSGQSSDFAIQPDEQLTLGYQTTFKLDPNNLTISNGYWSANHESGDVNDIYSGQVVNYTEYNDQLTTLEAGLAVPTIISDDTQTCANAPFNLPGILGDMNLTMDVNTSETDQYDSAFGNNGCGPTSIGWILDWWAEHGIKPTDNDTAVPDPISADNKTEMIRLINALGGYFGTTAAGSQINQTINGLWRYIRENNLPLKATILAIRNETVQYDGNTSIANIQREFVDNREGVTLLIKNSTMYHAVTLIGLNTTHDGGPCGWKAKILDPLDGEVHNICLNTGDSDDNSIGQIRYQGNWLWVVGAIAISPSAPDAEVDDNADAEEDSHLVISQLNKSLNGIRFNYHVQPVNGGLIDTFAVETEASDISQFSDFVVPENWTTTLVPGQDGNVTVFFHNNLYLGNQAPTLNETGFTFSMIYNTTTTTTGYWTTTHSGLSRIDHTAEATGTIIVPTETDDTSPTTSPPNTTATTSTGAEITTIVDGPRDTDPFSNLPISPVYIISAMIMVPIIRKFKNRG